MLYPKEYREEYGPHMVQVFRDLSRVEARRGGGTELMRLQVRVNLDLTSSAVTERSCAESEETFASKYKLAGAGFVLLLAPLYSVSASLLNYGLGVGSLFEPIEHFLSDSGRQYVFNLVAPVAYLGGLVLALALNGYSFVRVGVGREVEC